MATNPPDARRRRYERSPSPGALVALTPTKIWMLRYLSEMRFLSLPQLARLCCPSGRKDLSEKRARRHMRELFDAGLVDVLPVCRAALAPPGSPNDASLLYGSAPNVYAPTREGLGLLLRAGLIGEETVKRLAPAYGPRNGLFLAHELGVRDVRVWLEAAARGGGHEVERWHDGEEAVIPLERPQPMRAVRPDAWFVYRVATVVLVGLVEVDRGTERGERRWREKLDVYSALFAGRDLTRTTGYRNARVLVLCPDTRRRDGLCQAVAEAVGPLAARFWVTEQAALEDPDLCNPLWLQPGRTGLHPLLPGPS